MKNFAFLSIEIIVIILALATLSFLYFRGKQSILLSLIISTYPTILIYNNLSNINFKNQTLEILTLIFLYFSISWILNKNISSNSHYSRPFIRVIDSVCLSFSYIILIISTQINELSIMNSVYKFSDSLIKFVDFIPYSLSLIIPLILIFFFNRRNT